MRELHSDYRLVDWPDDELTFQASEVDRKVEEASAVREQEDALATVLSAREFHR